MINQLKNARRFKFILFNETKFRLINFSFYNDLETSLNKLNHLIFEDFESILVKPESFYFNKTFKEIFPDKTEYKDDPNTHWQQEYNKHFRKTL